MSESVTRQSVILKMTRDVVLQCISLKHKDELQQFAAAAEVQRQQRIADNDDNAEHFVAVFRGDQTCT